MTNSLDKEFQLLAKKCALSFLVFALVFMFAGLALRGRSQKQLAFAYTQASRFSLTIRDLRQAVASLQPALDAGFLNIEVLDSDESNLITLPNRSSLEGAHRVFVERIDIPIVVDMNTDKGKLLFKLQFYYSNFEFVLGIVSFEILILLISFLFYRHMQANIYRDYSLSLAMERKVSINALAAQVAHDIRSPLAALEMVVKTLPEVQEQKRLLIRDALGRIRDIANNLLQKNHETTSVIEAAVGEEAGSEQSRTQLPTNATSTELLSIAIDSLVSEKRMQFRSQLDIEIDSSLGPASYGIFAAINTVEFKRMISNLVNNAVEALGDKGRVSVSLEQVGQSAVIKITDNGPGIALKILAKLGARGVTHGKKGGSGLGLHHARSTAEIWGGSVDIASTVGSGTTVSVSLPLAAAPAWFVEKLILSEASTVVVLDDDTSIHQIWDGRLESQNAETRGIEILHFSTPDQIRAFVKTKVQGEINSFVYLFDFELLGYKESGLDLIEELQIQDHTILVTSRYEEPHVRTRCERLGVRLIPKGLAGFVPIEIQKAVVKTATNVDAVLIDDDILVHQVWLMAARDANKTLLCFEGPSEFLRSCAAIAKSTTIYIDSTLRDGIVGEMAAKDIIAQGFEHVVLATGKDPSELHAMPWIKKIVGKEPPF